MKLLNHRIFILSAFMLAVAGCSSPTEEVEAIVPTTRVYHSQAPLISPTDTAAVRQLFKKNNLSPSKLQAYSYTTDGWGSHVRCYQVFNGLMLFADDVVFSFDNSGICTFIGGDTLSAITIDTMPKVSSNVAGNLFYHSLESDPEKNSFPGGFHYERFNAELGYFDLSHLQGLPSPQFVLAWKVTIADREPQYPVAYVRADSPTLIWYSNGIIIG